MLRYKKTLASVFFVFILLMIFTFINKDDELHPDIPAFLELSAPVPATDGHAVLYALDAPLGSDVVALGHNAIESFQINHDRAEFEFENSLTVNLNRPCLDDIPLCFESIKNGSMLIKELTHIDLELQKRINIIKTIAPKGNVLEPLSDTPYPHFPLMFNVQNNMFEHLIENFLNGNTKAPLDYLYEDTKILRDINKSSADIVLKLVFKKMIDNNIELITIFSKNNKNATTIEEMILPEVDLKSELSREIYYLYNTISKLNSELSDTGLIFEDKTLIDNLYSKILFKSNRTINKYYEHINYQIWQEGINFNEYNNREFSKYNKFAPTLTNFVGDVLNGIASPSYHKYQIQLLSTSCKITKYNKSINPQHTATTILTIAQCKEIEHQLEKKDT